jgi:hypothetical protein
MMMAQFLVMAFLVPVAYASRLAVSIYFSSSYPPLPWATSLYAVVALAALAVLSYRGGPVVRRRVLRGLLGVALGALVFWISGALSVLWLNAVLPGFQGFEWGGFALVKRYWTDAELKEAALAYAATLRNVRRAASLDLDRLVAASHHALPTLRANIDQAYSAAVAAAVEESATWGYRLRDALGLAELRYGEMTRAVGAAVGVYLLQLGLRLALGWCVNRVLGTGTVLVPASAEPAAAPVNSCNAETEELTKALESMRQELSTSNEEIALLTCDTERLTASIAYKTLDLLSVLGARGLTEETASLLQTETKSCMRAIEARWPEIYLDLLALASGE